MVSTKEISEKLRDKREGKGTEGYLVCDKCKVDYDLEAGESPDDFLDECECGGILRYVEVSKNSDNNFCKNCGKINLANAKFCTKCGSPLDSATKMICQHCGTENSADAQFCQECAYNLKPQIIPQTTQSVPDDELGVKKGLSAGEAIVICLFSPIAGAIAYLIWHDNKTKKANQSCIIAIVAFCVLFFGYFVGSVIYRAYFDSSYSIDAQGDVEALRQGMMILPLLVG